MRRPVTLVVVLTVVLALAAALAGPAAASDRSLALTVRDWALKIQPAAESLQKVTDRTTAAELIRRSRRLQTVATQAAAAIASEAASTPRGTKLKTLAQTAFADFAQAGKLLVSAVQDLQKGIQAGTDAKLKRATTLASEGEKLLTQAGPLAKRLAS